MLSDRTCCATPTQRPLYSFKVPWTGEHIRIIFCMECRYQYEVEVAKPGEYQLQTK